MEREYALTDLLRRPGVSYASLHTLPGAGTPVADEKVAEQVEVSVKYAGYIDRQHDEVARHLTQETLRIPADPRLPRRARPVQRGPAEARPGRPETVGQAARISGVTPAAISLLLVHLKRGTRRRPPIA